MQSARPGSSPPRRLVAAVAGSLAVLGSCGSGDPPTEPAVDAEAAYLARYRAAGLFAEEEFQGAAAELAPLVEGERPAPMDLVWASAVEFAASEFPRAREYAQRAIALDGELPNAWYVLGELELNAGNMEDALAAFERAHTLAPGDYPSRLEYANTLVEFDRFDEAEPHYRALLEVGLDFSGSWYLSTLKRYSSMLRFAGRDDESRARYAEFEELQGRGITAPSRRDFDRGVLGNLLPPAPRGTAPEPRTLAPTAPTSLAELFPAEPPTGLAPWTLIDDWIAPDPARGTVEHLVDPPDLVAWGPLGVWAAERLDDGSFQPRRIYDADERVATVVPFALGEGEEIAHPERIDFDLDFWVADGARLVLVEDVEGEYTPREAWTLELPAPPEDVVVVDYDHEGDLDVLAVGAFGARLFRNDGASFAGDGTFVDVTDEAGLGELGATSWCVTEDYDNDQDVDLLLGSDAGSVIASNLRGGLFELRRSPVEAFRSATRPVVADLDADGRPDLWNGAELWFAQLSGAYRRVPTPEVGDRARLDVADLDLDGALDALDSGDAAALGVRLALGLEVGARATLPHGLDAPPALVRAADFDGDLVDDLAWWDPSGQVSLLRREQPGNAIRLALRGKRDNARGVGAVVELLAGPVYRRVYWRGEPLVLGLGAQAKVDVLRVRWPNGVVQYEVDIPADGHRLIEQKAGLEGSCPFLYTWNGETYEFISDILGITPLGLPMAPGLLVPPDHDEFVLVRGDQLAPKDGVLEIQITEELREVTYLDRVRLDVVDHPADVEVQPNERFCFPPFPEAHTHTSDALLAPTSAVGSDGVDWTAALASVDGEYAAPFEPLGAQLQGLATPHFLELAFDPDAVRDAPELRLFCTGWFYWSNASVNVATARTPGVDFVPPTLQVPDGEGGWRDAGPPVGFPAGKTKTMVLDVADVLDRDDPRIRLFGTLRLYWDSIRLAVDADDAPLVVTELEPTSALLWERGYSEAQVVHPEYGLEWFEWELQEGHPRWDQHPGLYTKYGECLPLVTGIDDRFVVMGAGDALRVRFDADELPPLREGWTRDYLVFFDGWAKDRDPNAVEVLRVEPLPFHGMSGYPYGADESFPDTAEHRAWRREWQTRSAKQWLRPLAPNARPLPPADAPVALGAGR